MNLKFISFASGSSGNCYYLGTDHYGILIDAGIGIRTIRKNLKLINVPLSSIRSVFITHDHADHIKSVGYLGEDYHIPVYTTPEVHEGINQSHYIKERLSTSNIRYLHKEEPIQIEDFQVTAFEVPHDGTDNVGYCIEIDGRTFCFATDLGHITDTVTRYISRANYLILEANYDIEMLQMGTYPTFLKERISGPNGHLSNIDTANYLADHIGTSLKYVWLCHLSKDNNHPELALKTIEMVLQNHNIIVGTDIQIIPLKRTTPSELYEFE
jgi:phosphoribosyl 1,2-cyclic phosphodiesterase